MARGDLLVRLVRAGTDGDRPEARAAASKLIAEERANNHHVLADRLAMARPRWRKRSPRPWPSRSS